MFDAKKIREITLAAQEELERKKKEAEEFKQREKERLASEQAEKEKRKQEELRLREEEEDARRRLAKASSSFLQIVKRETVLKAVRGFVEAKINVVSDIDSDWITSELKERRFKVSWNAKADTGEISKVVELIDKFRRVQFIQNLPSGIPELDEVIESAGSVFDFLLENILHLDGAIYSKGRLSLAQNKWQRVTESWKEAFELASVYPVDEWSQDDVESQNVKLLKILRDIYECVNAMFEASKNETTVLNVWWDFDWLDGDQSRGFFPNSSIQKIVN